jgi:ketosteroid isomerase-like protein
MSNEAVSIVLNFEKKINGHDAAGIVSAFAPDGRFVDSLGNVIGMDKMQAAWTAYFRMVPDYRVSHEEVFANDGAVALFGKAEGTYSADGKLSAENFWTAPASWLAKVEGGRIKEWRVYCDNEPIRAVMRRAQDVKR